eukprot:scaffold3188_cov68-Phaeocystis_antarctica.AAC.5
MNRPAFSHSMLCILGNFNPVHVPEGDVPRTPLQPHCRTTASIDSAPPTTACGHAQAAQARTLSEGSAAWPAARSKVQKDSRRAATAPKALDSELITGLWGLSLRWASCSRSQPAPPPAPRPRPSRVHFSRSN